MDSQTIINTAIALVGFLGGWILKVVWEAVKELQIADKILVDKVNTIEILIAGNYMSKQDFEKVADAIFAKLDKIDDKLDRKVDK
jgi:nicotinic acid phosphoribosyltransferase